MTSNLGTPEPPRAVRATSPGWRDPRLWIGVLIVALSVVAGARLLGSADDSVAVWAVASDMGAGDAVESSDLVAQRVRFVDEDNLDSYFVTDDELPGDVRLERGVGAGELLPRAAVGPAADSDTLELPVAVDAARVPPSVQAGSVVDVYLTPASAPDPEGVASCRPCRGGVVLTGVTVIDAPRLDESFAGSGQRQLVLGVADQDARAFFRALGLLDSPTLTVVRRG